MNKIAIGALSCASLVLSGCNMILREVRYPGGYPGYVLDQRTFDASENKSLQLLRASILLAMAARIGEANVDPEDADAFADQIAEAAAELNYSAFVLGYGDRPASTVTETSPSGDVTVTQVDARYSCSTLGEYRGPDRDVETDYANCAAYYVNFEASVSRIESRIVRAMLTALSTDEARKFLDRVVEGNIFGALVSLIDTFGNVAGSFHRGAGVYRSGMETVAAGIGNCKLDRYFGTASRGEKFDEFENTTLAAAACLGLARDDLFGGDEISAIELGKLSVRPGAFHATFLIVRQACVGLPLANSLELADLIESRNKRRIACDSLVFAPRPRSLEIAPLPPGEDEDAGGEDQQQATSEQLAPGTP